jgi:hypothetical protein
LPGPLPGPAGSAARYVRRATRAGVRPATRTGRTLALARLPVRVASGTARGGPRRGRDRFSGHRRERATEARRRGDRFAGHRRDCGAATLRSLCWAGPMARRLGWARLSRLTSLTSAGGPCLRRGSRVARSGRRSSWPCLSGSVGPGLRSGSAVAGCRVNGRTGVNGRSGVGVGSTSGAGRSRRGLARRRRRRSQAGRCRNGPSVGWRDLRRRVGRRRGCRGCMAESAEIGPGVRLRARACCHRGRGGPAACLSGIVERRRFTGGKHAGRRR